MNKSGRTTTHLGEIADKMVSLFVILGNHVKEKRFDVVVESLVVKKHLGNQTEVLAVDFVPPAVDFKHRNVFVSIDFVARWVF